METLKTYFDRLSTGDPPGVYLSEESFTIRIAEDKEKF